MLARPRVRWSEGRCITVMVFSFLKITTMALYLADSLGAALQLLRPQQQRPDPVQMQAASVQLVFAAYLLAELMASTQVVLFIAWGRWTAPQLIDHFSILMSVNSPFMNILYALINPAGAARKNFRVGWCLLMALGVVSGGSATHACFQWIATAPAIIFIEYRTTAVCLSPPDLAAAAPHTHVPCHATNQFFSFLLTRGIGTMTLSLLSALATLIFLGQQPPVASPLHPVASHLQPVTSHPQPVTSRLQPVTSHPQPVTSHPQPVTSHPQPVTSHLQPVTLHPQPVTSHPQPVTPHPQPVTSHLQPMTSHLQPANTPYSTLGISCLEAFGRHPYLARLEAWIAHMRSGVRAWGSSMFVWLPISMYYMVFAILSRTSLCLLSDVSPEEWIGAMLACIMLGRCSGRHDEDFLARQIRTQLQRSRTLLVDLLPSHIVEHLLTTPTTPTHDETPELAPEPDPHEPAGPEETVAAAQPCPVPGFSAASALRSGSFGRGSCPGTPLHPAASKAANTLSQSHDCCTVIFADLCGFSTWAHHLPPGQVMDTLNDLFSRLDDVIIHEMTSLDKVDTVGDSYVVCSNLLTPDPEHAATAVLFALRAQQVVSSVPRPGATDGSPLQMRIGLHSGPLTSGVLGRLRRRFSIYGDTVNMGARTETSCPPGGIQVTASTYQLAVQHLPDSVVFVERGEVQVKGSDQPLKMYCVTASTGFGAGHRHAARGAAPAAVLHSSCSLKLDDRQPAGPILRRGQSERTTHTTFGPLRTPREVHGVGDSRHTT